MLNYHDLLQAVGDFKERIDYMMGRLTNKGNVINSNHAQGVLIMEGCSANIVSNHILSSLKANIALGGEGTENTRVVKNLIERGKKEGIFVVEGEEELVIYKNLICSNETGIVLLHSCGEI